MAETTRNSKHRETPKEELAGYLKKGMTHRQISEHTNIPVNTISNRIYRCGLNKKSYQPKPMCEATLKATSAELKDNYTELFIAIYLQAVRDDCLEVRKSVEGRLHAKGYKLTKIAEYIKANSDYIDSEVKKAVCRESAEYGGDTRQRQKESINRVVNHLVNKFEAAR